MSRFDERKQAKALNALDVRELIKSRFPALPLRMTTDQIDHLQRVLDVAVVNAAVDTEFDELDRKSIQGRIVGSNEYLRDPAKADQAKKVLKKKLAEQRNDHVVRLDFEKLLAANALTPTSDNPDEAAYLLKVKNEYQRLGVWLRITGDSSAMALNLHPNPTDPKRWRVELILGYNPNGVIEPIESDTGMLTQKSLLSATYRSRVLHLCVQWPNPQAAERDNRSCPSTDLYRQGASLRMEPISYGSQAGSCVGLRQIGRGNLAR